MTLLDSTPVAPAGGATEHHRVVIVGTGFAGIGMAIRLKQQGVDDFVVLERAAGPGGTWRDNTYPGCQCDVPSNLYSFSFAPNPAWSTTYPLQPELHEYLQRTTDQFDVTPHVRWSTPLVDASWDEGAELWRITTPSRAITASYLVLAVGPLAEPSTPAIPGFETFEGTVFHSARWNHDHDLAGERVAVIGTGASAVQIVPCIQPEVGHLDLYQRTPAWVMPHPNRKVSRLEHFLFRHFPSLQRLRRGGTYVAHEARIVAFAKCPPILRGAERIAKWNIRRGIKDPDLAARLTPDYRMGCKRILMSDSYYPALGAANVEVVTDGIRAITPTGLVANDGTERPVDTIVLATGFHVIDSPSYRLVHGVGGRDLLDAFDEHGAYLGTTAHGFPNMFVLSGPNTGIGHTSLVYMIESQLTYILDALRQMDERGLATVDLRQDVQDAWFAEMQHDTEGTVWASGCESWYLDAEGRNAVLWPGFTFQFRHRTKHFDLAAYDTTAARSSSVAATAASAAQAR